MPLRVKSLKNDRYYYLHSKKVLLKNHKKVRLFYYFAGEPDERHVLHRMPDGWEAVENQSNGVPFLRKVRG